MLDLNVGFDGGENGIPLSRNPIAFNNTRVSVNTESPAANQNEKLLAISDLTISVTGILYYEQLGQSLTPTQKIFLSILNNISKSSDEMSITLTNDQIVKRSNNLFSYMQVRRHLCALEERTVLFRYEGNGRREFIIRDEEFYNRKKFVTIFNLVDSEGRFCLNDRDSLVFSYLLNHSAFYARAGIGLITDDSSASTISMKLGISKQTLKRAYNSLISLGVISFAQEKKSKTDRVVKPVNFNIEIANKYSEKVHLEESECCRRIVEKRYRDDRKNRDSNPNPSSQELKNFIQKIGKGYCKNNRLSNRLSTSSKLEFSSKKSVLGKVKKFKPMSLNQKRSFQQVKSNLFCKLALIKRDRFNNKDLNDHIKLNSSNAKARENSESEKRSLFIPKISTDDLGIKLFTHTELTAIRSLNPDLKAQKSLCSFVVRYGSPANTVLNLNHGQPYYLMKINSQPLDGLAVTQIEALLKQKRLCLELTDNLLTDTRKVLFAREL